SFYQGVAPSTSAASYRYEGIVCRTPVHRARLKGKPSQNWISRMATLVQKGSVSQGIASIPTACSIWLIGPKSSLNIPANTRTETKEGTAQGRIKMVRNSFFPFTRSRLSSTDKRSPRANSTVVETNVHTTVQDITLKRNCARSPGEKVERSWKIPPNP